MKLERDILTKPRINKFSIDSILNSKANKRSDKGTLVRPWLVNKSKLDEQKDEDSFKTKQNINNFLIKNHHNRKNVFYKYNKIHKNHLENVNIPPKSLLSSNDEDSQNSHLTINSNRPHKNHSKPLHFSLGINHLHHSQYSHHQHHSNYPPKYNTNKIENFFYNQKLDNISHQTFSHDSNRSISHNINFHKDQHNCNKDKNSNFPHNNLKESSKYPLEALFVMTKGCVKSVPQASQPLQSADVSYPIIDGVTKHLMMRHMLKKHRKTRTAFSNDQLLHLERRFKLQKYLTPTDRDEIASSLKLSNSQVITWFQNRRAKLKRDMEELKADVKAATALISPTL